jgi:CheY-like chemotaxis protein
MRTPLEILLVEDNEGDVDMTQRVLRDSKPACNISVANDGVEALDCLFKRGNFASAPRPQLILLDINMPRMDGKQFLEIVKAESGLKAIPVIMLTSSQSSKDIRECYERHASGYVVKPFDGAAYADALRQIVNFWTGLGQLPSSQ